ncbi:MAG: hypothetical protein NC324_02500 [Bacteroides sp.]|nr:hypothetical protein [Bacteroides sp.]
MKDLEKELAGMAKRKGICKEWHDRLAVMKDKDAMVEMYIRGIDFCLSNDYPGNDFIREHFKGMMEPHGVFLDDSVDVRNIKHCVLLGRCSGKVTVDGYKVSEVFLKDDAAVTLEVSGNAFVMVDMFDRSRLDVRACGNAKVCVNRYGGNVVNVLTGGDSAVKVKEKGKSTY